MLSASAAGADREHPPDADLGRGGVDADFHEVGAEGRLLVLPGEVAELHQILGHEAALARLSGPLSTANALFGSAAADLAIAEARFRGVRTLPFGRPAH